MRGKFNKVDFFFLEFIGNGTFSYYFMFQVDVTNQMFFVAFRLLRKKLQK